jgi:hypothetical protein
MNAGSLQEQVYDWLASHYPDGPQWDHEGFHCFKDCHSIIRSVLAMDAVEGELSNGAWGQLLWNTFPNWRVVLDLAKDGYVSMTADRQIDAIPRLSAKLTEYEKGCRAAMQRAGKGNFEKEFGGFTSIGYSDSKFEPQLAFLDPNLGTLRERWLERNREVILRAIAA